MAKDRVEIDEAKLRRLLAKRNAALSHYRSITDRRLELRGEIVRLDREERHRTRGRVETNTNPETENLRLELRQLNESYDAAERELNALDYVLEMAAFATRQGLRVDPEAGTLFRPSEGSAARIEKPLGAL